MGYTSEKNIQIIISLLKQYKIKNVIVSPGTTNITFVNSIQDDDDFVLFSSPDERSAAYMACGLAAESCEPVVISCTGATASRNYLPGLTEAYYRKLPVLALTSTQNLGRVGQLRPQVIDRSVLPKDACVYSTCAKTIHNKEDEYSCVLKINTALNMLYANGGGPVHINLETTYSNDYSLDKLPKYNKINYFRANQELPDMSHYRVAVFIGSHQPMSKKLQDVISRFAELYNCVVFCDHTSNYFGKNKIIYNLVADQQFYKSNTLYMDLLIDIGNVCASYLRLYPKKVWRVSPDGKIQDRWNSLSSNFCMEEYDFFNNYCKKHKGSDACASYYKECLNEYGSIFNELPELPFSNIWIAKELSSIIPKDSVMHLGILNTIRSWNFFNLNNCIECYSNTGGFGIDGIVSSFLGSCLSRPSKIHYLFVGDLAFFYDLNSLANRHFPRNARILLINNGCGVEFKNYNHPAYKLGDAANDYIAAMGHYGNKSKFLVKNYVENLGFEYLSASNKENFKKNIIKSFIKQSFDKPLVFEVFTDVQNESLALKMVKTVRLEKTLYRKRQLFEFTKKIISEKRLSKFLNFIKKI